MHVDVFEGTSKRECPNKRLGLSLTCRWHHQKGNIIFMLLLIRREFRAKLVAREKGVGDQQVDGERWAYDSGNLVEQGSLLLGGTDLEFGFGLRQQV
jgi:hypothetical protein